MDLCTCESEEYVTLNEMKFISRTFFRMRSNCVDKTKRKISVPGNVNHDCPSFFGEDKLGLFVRNPSSEKQIPCLMREGRMGKKNGMP